MARRSCRRPLTDVHVPPPPVRILLRTTAIGYALRCVVLDVPLAIKTQVGLDIGVLAYAILALMTGII